MAKAAYWTETDTEIIKNRYKAFDNEKIPIKDNQILHRITYIVFPIWKFEELATEFQEMF